MNRTHAERIKFELADSVIETARRLHNALHHDHESIEDAQWEAEDALGHTLGYLKATTTQNDPEMVTIAEGFIHAVHIETVSNGECATINSGKAEGATDALVKGAP